MVEIRKNKLGAGCWYSAMGKPLFRLPRFCFCPAIGRVNKDLPFQYFSPRDPRSATVTNEELLIMPLARKWTSGFQIFSLLFLIIAVNGMLAAQTPAIDKKGFFTDERLIEMTIKSDFKKLIQEKLKEGYKEKYRPATLTCLFPDSLKVTEEVEIRPRGNYRREACNMPPLYINFAVTKAVTLKKLGRLKLVWSCGTSPYDEQLVLKEYLAYKMYNLLTEKSFRVRLVKMTYLDENDKLKPLTHFAFFLEDVDYLAKRNKCVEFKSGRIPTELTDRQQTTLVSLFEYMIGNSDWVIPIQRNIKLIRSKEDSLSRPYAVPYDLDYSGLVNAKYAVPPEGLPITSVRERYYLGFPRTMQELQLTIDIFRKQRAGMDSLIMNCAHLNDQFKKEMKNYLDEFFKILEKERDVKEIFINNARLE